MFLKYSLLLFSLCFFQSCSDKKDNLKGELIQVDIKDAVLAEVRDFKIDKNKIVLKIAQLKLNVCTPKSIIQHNKFIFVYDQYAKTIMAFDKSGAFMYSIDHLGQGPGEYNTIDDFGIKNEYMYVVDNTLSKMVYYNKLDGKFITEQKIKIRPINRMVYFNDYFIVQKGVTEQQNPKQRYQFYFCKPNMKIKSAQLPYNGGSSIVFSPLNSIQQVGNDISILPTYDQTIYSLDKTNNLIPKYTIDFGDKNINQDEMLNDPKYNKSNEWVTTKLKEFPSIIFLNFFENSKYIWYYYDFQSNHYSTIFNKKTNKIKTYDLGKYGKESKIITGLNRKPIGVIDDKFAFSYDSDELSAENTSVMQTVENANNNTPQPILLLIEPNL